MNIEYRTSYYPPPRPPHSHPWTVADVADELERLTTTVADHGILIETAIPDEERDLIGGVLFDQRRRSHRTYEFRRVIQGLRQGFTPALSALEAARLIALELASDPTRRPG